MHYTQVVDMPRYSLKFSMDTMPGHFDILPPDPIQKTPPGKISETSNKSPKTSSSKTFLQSSRTCKAHEDPRPAGTPPKFSPEAHRNG